MNELHTLIQQAQNLEAKQGQRHKAFARLVHNYQDMAYAYALGFLGDFHLAQDAAQEAFLVAYEKLDQLRDPAAFALWLRRIVRTQCNHLMQENNRTLKPAGYIYDEPPVELDPATVIENKGLCRHLSQAIRNLPQNQREPLTLHYISGYSYKEIAKLLDISPVTCRKRVQRARDRLKEMMLETVQDGLKEYQPSVNGAFATQVMEIIEATSRGNVVKVRSMLEETPALVEAKGSVTEWEQGKHCLLHLAVAKGDQEMVELLLDNGADIHTKNESGATPLETAVIKNQWPVVDFLIRRGAEVNINSAVRMGDVDRITRLLKEDPSLLQLGRDGRIPIHSARTAEVIQTFLAYGADARQFPLVAVCEDRELTDLLIAHGARADLYAAVGMDDLVQAGVLLEEDCGRANLCDRALYSIMRTEMARDEKPLHHVRSAAMSRLLLNYGADIEAKTGHMQTPLDRALTRTLKQTGGCYEKDEVVECLIEMGAVVDIVIAARMNDLDRIRTCIEKDPRSVAGRKTTGETPLHRAQSEEIARLLLDHGADPNARLAWFDGGYTVLHAAAGSANYPVVRLLIEAGADPQSRCVFNRTPLDWLRRQRAQTDIGPIEKLIRKR